MMRQPRQRPSRCRGSRSRAPGPGAALVLGALLLCAAPGRADALQEPSPSPSGEEASSVTDRCEPASGDPGAGGAEDRVRGAAGHREGGQPAAIDGRRAVGPRIDTVVVEGEDLFGSAGEEPGFVHGVLNDLHVETRGGVIRRELLLGADDPFDCALAAETERNLRARGLFRHVEVDTTRLGEQLALVVHTRDAWSLEPRVDVQVASDGTLAGTVGALERNIAGTGNLVHVQYLRDVERDGLVVGARADRAAGTGLLLAGAYHGLSDRTFGGWALRLPFRSLSDRWMAAYDGHLFDGRVLEYRNHGGGARDTSRWQRSSQVHRLEAGRAVAASPRGYLRVGALVEVRREGFAPWRAEADGFEPPSTVPDTSYGHLGAFAEWRRADFEVLRYLNGFTEEDVDLSRRFRLAVHLAPGSWGYRRTGVGPRLTVQAGERAGRALIRGSLVAGGLLSGAGLDSGRVVATGKAALLSAHRQVTFVEAAGGLQRASAPGQAFDLGFLSGPRLWDPHAFTGTRAARLSLEHRWYALDRVLDMFGAGAGAFLEYGGAWYGDQPPRFGGDVGASLFFGWSLGSAAQVSQIAVGYRFGGGPDSGEGWAVSVGNGLSF